MFARAIASLLAVCAISALGTESLSARELTVLFRYDDFSHESNMELEIAMFEAAREVGGGVLVGVIPFLGKPYPPPDQGKRIRPLALTPKQLALLRDYATQGVIEIALHGYNHQNNARRGPSSEFAGLPEETQIQLIGEAKASLEAATGKPIRVFVPPYNAYDTATLNALQKTAFPALSAGIGGTTQSGSRTAILPGGPYPHRLPQVIATALSKGHSDALVVVEMHPYDFVESGETLPVFRAGKGQINVKQWREDLKRVRKYGGIQFASVTEFLENGEDLSVERFQANAKLRKSLVSTHELLPKTLDLYPLPGLYYSRGAANRMYWYQISLAAALYGAVALLLILLTRKTLSRIQTPYAEQLAIAVAALVLVVVIANSLFAGFYLSSAVVVVCSLGILTGVATMRPTRAARKI